MCASNPYNRMVCDLSFIVILRIENQLIDTKVISNLDDHASADHWYYLVKCEYLVLLLLLMIKDVIDVIKQVI